MVEREIPLSVFFLLHCRTEESFFTMCVCLCVCVREREREKEMINAELLLAQELTMEMKNQL